MKITKNYCDIKECGAEITDKGFKPFDKEVVGGRSAYLDGGSKLHFKNVSNMVLCPSCKEKALSSIIFSLYLGSDEYKFTFDKQ